ncbi:hypothetical protein GPL21_05800 [Bradyrhizobium pachyrhizi]|uniref:Uncharacterized protein n=1 Tax=Bradyrhizobium pachyrhizi TaxID=280333 RepID=A0A844SC44_9BRAD|nr:hypothetical protein [Bradyrhizobium pachyrhizi]MVT64628.1 hypothetical protein [Bradyrhizobium pachyrhizi]
MTIRSYTAHILGPNGRIANRIDLLCLNEAAAKESAKALADDDQIELLCQGGSAARLVPALSRWMDCWMD